MYIGGLHARLNAVDRCVTDPGRGDLPILEQCDIAVSKGLNLHWDFKQVGCISMPPHFDKLSHYEEPLNTFLAKQLASE